MVRPLKILVVELILLLAWGFMGTSAIASEKQKLPLSVRRVLYQAQTLIEKKNIEEARRKLEAHRLNKQGSHYLIEFTLGDIWMLKSAYPRAAEAYRKALDLNPDFAPAWMNLGKAAYEMADYLKAADCIHRAYRTDTEPHPVRLYYSATAFLMAEKPQQGLAVFQELIDRHPTAVKLEWKPTLVQLYLDMGKPREALPIIEELAAKSIDPHKLQWQETLLGHYLQLGKTDRALAYSRELTHDAPTVSRWWKARAHILLQQSDHEAALQSLMIYIKLTAPDKSEQRLLADLNLHIGIPTVAAHYYRNLADGEPDAEIVTLLVHTLRLIDKEAEALEQLDRFLATQYNPQLLWMKGEILYEMKRYATAAEIFRRCTQARSMAGQAWLMAGYAAWQAQDLAHAKKAFMHASTYSDQKMSALAALKEIANSRHEPES